MANPEHLKILKQGVEVWNKWRAENPEVEPDLSGIELFEATLYGRNLSKANISGARLLMASLIESDLTEANLTDANLSGANLSGANLTGATLFKANLSKANLAGSNLFKANLKRAKLSGANLSITNLSKANLSNTTLLSADLFDANLFKANLKRAKLSGANLSVANLSNANFSEADLSLVQLVRTDLSNAKLERARIYGISAWDIKKDGLIQKDLIITPPGEPEITVDDLEVAQFIYLMLNNERIKHVIETITSKAVLILGNFDKKTGRKQVLDALKDELRRRNYLPIVFDFENAGNKSVDETVNLLARMSRFVVADITDAKSIPQELRGIVPDNPSVPIVPLIWAAQREYGMFDHFRKYPWVLDLHEYESPEILLENIIPAIIAPAEQKVAELRGK